MDTKQCKEIKKNLISDIVKRQEDQIIEESNAKLLIKLIENADDLNEAINIAALGTTYKRTGFHFDKRLEKLGDDIKYFKKNEKLSFVEKESSSKSKKSENDAEAKHSKHVGAKQCEPVHKLIIGDNYDALQNLLIQYKGKVDVIYIDPPYGKDSMGEFAETNYDNAITRDNLLSMLYNRLILARELLSDEGVIFCSIDDRNHAYVKGLFDIVFGENNFVASVVWNSINSVLKQSKFIRKEHEYILIYSKNKESLDFNKLENTMVFENIDSDPNGAWFSSNAASPDQSSKTNRFKIKLPSGNYCIRTWKFSKEQYESGEISLYFKGDNVPRLKIYEKDCNKNTRTASSIFKDLGSITTAKTELEKIGLKDLFDTPKPTELLKYILKIGSKENSIVLDFFAGSGTTGQAVLELNKEDGGNRQFILCTNNEKTDATPKGIAYDVTSKRLKRVMTGKCYDNKSNFEWIKKNEALGGSLDVYEIESVFNKEKTKGKSAFDVIDETLYGLEKFKNKNDKIKWVCENFEHTQKYLEGK